ncbi:hypothetical protein SAMN05421578_104207 [Paenibacillus macquariensis]|uniref:Uncharacterized protein n=1 Tax=Paenibacillus macquariensis TaxID=948756 RepID=A0ABY1JUX4_9BACL|nr:hypothetical protein SAMN05421578_104207 [Paenibacillus macquariensis]
MFTTILSGYLYYFFSFLMACLAHPFFTFDFKSQEWMYEKKRGYEYPPKKLEIAYIVVLGFYASHFNLGKVF